MRGGWMVRRLVIVVAAVVGGGAKWSSGGEDPAGCRFEFVLDSHLKITEKDKTETMSIDALTKLTYDLTSRPGTIDISIHSLDLAAKVGDKAVTSHFDRHKSRFKDGPEDRHDVYDQAAPLLRKIMEEYDRPVATIEVDSEGSETGRTFKIDAKSLFVAHGTIDITQIFHGRFPRDKDRWEAPVKLPVGNGQYARGSLKYQRTLSTTAGGPVRVKVSGELQLTGNLVEVEYQNGRMTISGEQAYDPSLWEWTSGDLDIALNYNLVVNGKIVSSASGTMKATLRRVASSPTKPPTVGGGLRK